MDRESGELELDIFRAYIMHHPKFLKSVIHIKTTCNYISCKLLSQLCRILQIYTWRNSGIVKSVVYDLIGCSEYEHDPKSIYFHKIVYFHVQCNTHKYSNVTLTSWSIWTKNQVSLWSTAQTYTSLLTSLCANF